MAAEFIKTAIIVLVRVEMLLMLIRAVMSWFAGTGGYVYGLIAAVTEPVIYPIRVLCGKFMPQTALPIDIPFIAAYLLLYVTELILSVL